MKWLNAMLIVNVVFISIYAVLFVLKLMLKRKKRIKLPVIYS